MAAFELSWFLKIDNQRTCGIKPQATLADSLPQIRTALNNSGVVSIALVNCPKYGRQRLQLHTENGHSLVTLGEVDPLRSHVRGYAWSRTEAANDSPTSKPRADKQVVCSGDETVYEIFEEFFATGEVSGERLV